MEKSNGFRHCVMRFVHSRLLYICESPPTALVFWSDSIISFHSIFYRPSCIFFIFICCVLSEQLKWCVRLIENSCNVMQYSIFGKHWWLCSKNAICSHLEMANGECLRRTKSNAQCTMIRVLSFCIFFLVWNLNRMFDVRVFMHVVSSVCHLYMHYLLIWSFFGAGEAFGWQIFVCVRNETKHAIPDGRHIVVVRVSNIDVRSLSTLCFLVLLVQPIVPDITII